VFLPVGEIFAMLSPQSQVEEVDRLLAAHFAQRSRFTSPKAMAPLPAFGIPGWHPGTACEAYYDCTEHFRRKRGAGAVSP